LPRCCTFSLISGSRTRSLCGQMCKNFGSPYLLETVCRVWCVDDILLSSRSYSPKVKVWPRSCVEKIRYYNNYEMGLIDFDKITCIYFIPKLDELVTEVMGQSQGHSKVKYLSKLLWRLDVEVLSNLCIYCQLFVVNYLLIFIYCYLDFCDFRLHKLRMHWLSVVLSLTVIIKEDI